VFTKLIEKNTTVPTKKSQIFSTAADNQPAVSIHVLQGEREMAQHNKTIGRFDLADIPPAPRGVPQIEVAFDLDANGILHVSAKDLGTNKEQSIRITASSGLTEEEIERMKKDAELHADEDKKRKELVEAKNQGDSLIHMSEKSLKELGDKVDAATKSGVENEITKLKKAMEGNSLDEIKKASEALTQASHKLAEIMYSQAQAGQGPGGAGAAGGSTGGTKKDDDDVVDADFEEVK
ncbi:MAG: Hsp70 family protein, partial [Desulfobulbaceae bacterium]|nr:Hsp70 family protein [Desulfobulbaceae bacterium]